MRFFFVNSDINEAACYGGLCSLCCTLGMGNALHKAGRYDDEDVFVGAVGEGVRWFREQGMGEMSDAIAKNPLLPVVLNFLVYLSALFTPLAFSFDEQYRFVRGPLNWFMFAVCIGYLVLILVTMHKRFTFRRGGDFMVIYLCAAGCLGAMAVDIALGGITIVSAVLIRHLPAGMSSTTPSCEEESEYGKLLLYSL